MEETHWIPKRKSEIDRPQGLPRGLWKIKRDGAEMEGKTTEKGMPLFCIVCITSLKEGWKDEAFCVNHIFNAVQE